MPEHGFGADKREIRRHIVVSQRAVVREFHRTGKTVARGARRVVIVAIKHGFAFSLDLPHDGIRVAQLESHSVLERDRVLLAAALERVAVMEEERAGGDHDVSRIGSRAVRAEKLRVVAVELSGAGFRERMAVEFHPAVVGDQPGLHSE